jgi:hypothetical protein
VLVPLTGFAWLPGELPLSFFINGGRLGYIDLSVYNYPVMGSNNIALFADLYADATFSNLVVRSKTILQWLCPTIILPMMPAAPLILLTLAKRNAVESWLLLTPQRSRHRYRQSSLVIPGRFQVSIQPWKVSGFYTTSDVEKLLLRYKDVKPGSGIGRELGTPDPFKEYGSLLSRYWSGS